MTRRHTFTLGDRIRKARTEAGMDQERFAAELGVHRNTVTLWEHGTAQPRTTALIAVAAITDTDLAWLEEGRDGCH